MCACLAVRDVDFTFPSEPQKQILHKLSFVADAGSKVAFVGATGCGKSTSIQIIQRFYAQSSGTVLLDGRDIEEYDVHHLRRAISVVAQAPRPSRRAPRAAWRAPSPRRLARVASPASPLTRSASPAWLHS